MVMGLVIVKPPNPPGSRALISPPVAVFEMAPANVLHGAVREHGFASSPTPDTQVRVAWAQADADKRNSSAVDRMIFFISLAPVGEHNHVAFSWWCEAAWEAD